MRSRADLAGHFVEHAVKIHVLEGGQFFVQTGVLEHDSETLARLVVLDRWI